MEMKRMSKRVLVLSATVLLGGLTAVAQSTGGQPQQPMGAPGVPGANPNGMPGAGLPGADGSATTSQQVSDQAFVAKALQGGDAEVQLGQLAQQKSQSDDVKQFGQKMVQDHTQLGEQMKPIAKKLGVSEPKGPSKKDKKLMATLQGLSGAQFDQEYIKAMVKDHQQDLKEFKDEAQMSQDPNVQQAATMGSKVIAQHLQMIEQIAQAHNVAFEASNE
jgi:putative membrane protein